MAFYDYACPNCGFATTVSKPMAQATEPEYCPQNCAPQQPMQRQWEAPPAAHVHAGTPRFHHRKAR